MVNLMVNTVIFPSLTHLESLYVEKYNFLTYALAHVWTI